MVMKVVIVHARRLEALGQKRDLEPNVDEVKGRLPTMQWLSAKLNVRTRRLGSTDPSHSINRLLERRVCNKFDASETKDYDFHLENGSSIRVPFMTNRKKQMVRSNDGFKALRLPYKQVDGGRCFSVYLFLLDANYELSALVDRVSSELGFLENHLPFLRAVDVRDFRIPKFNISFGFEASQVLESLGLVLSFSLRGLTEMVDDESVGKKLSVSSIFQKCFIEIN